ncbi:MAG TPA: hypothetical protein VMH36_04000 [Alphaproteobacteria bacterium]|nr:hypothetical protein [Alphaproteobacteria bacterium]
MMFGSGDRADAPAPLEAFLSAGLGEEPNGMTLSVVSALARLDLDPYREAARLAALPRRDAATALARLVERLHHAGASVDGARITSLIQLLPKPQANSHPARARSRGPARLRRAQIGAIVALAATVIYLYATQPSLPEQTQPAHSSGTAER